MPWSFLRLVVSGVFAWYGFVEGKTLRFRFLFASEPVEDFLSAFLSAFFPFEFKYSTFYSAEHGSYPCRQVFILSSGMPPQVLGEQVRFGDVLHPFRHTPVGTGRAFRPAYGSVLEQGIPPYLRGEPLLSDG